MSVVVELDQGLAAGDAEEERGPDNQKSDAQVARHERNEEPVAQIREQLALAPPGTARVAGPEQRKESECCSKRYRNRHDLRKRDAHAVNDSYAFLNHDQT